MSIHDGKPLTEEEQIDLFREKELYAFWMDFLLLHWGTEPDRLFELMERRILQIKNSTGEEAGTSETVWDERILPGVPALERIAERIKSKLSAP